MASSKNTAKDVATLPFIEEYALVWFVLACVFFIGFVLTLTLYCISLMCRKSKTAEESNLPKKTAEKATLPDSDQAEVGKANPKQSKKKVSQQVVNKDSKKDAQLGDKAKGKDEFQIPVGNKVVDRRDPNYQSLKGITNDVFKKCEAEKKKEEAKTPRNEYETLDNVEKEEKETATKEESKKTKFRPPDKVVKVASKDPQYETLADIDEHVFKKKESGGSRKSATDAPTGPVPLEKEKTAADEEEQEEEVRPKKIPFKRPEMVKVSAKNPQYETFADVADDIFKGKK